MSSYRFCQSVLKFILLLLVPASSATLYADDSVDELDPPMDVPFTSKVDGTEQRYVVRLPKDFDVKKPHHLLIALHGHGSDRWQFISDARDECRAARDTASIYQMIYVSPDYRAKTSWMGPAAESDMLQMLDDLNRQYRIENVIISGGSMGGTSALAFAAMHPEHVDGIVSMNGTANLVEYAGFADAIFASYGGTKAEKPNEYHKRSAELFPERLRMPVGLTTGGLDTLVPPDSTLRLAALLNQRELPVRLIHRPEGGHETTYIDAMDAFRFVMQKSNEATDRLQPLLTFDGKPRTIVCLGDSVTGVYYHTGGRRAYPEMLELGLRRRFPQTPVTVINAGISGNTTQNGLDRLETDVLSKKPDLVTISFGLNDVVRVTPEAFRVNLETLVVRCREQRSEVVLCTPNAVIDTASRPINKVVDYCEIIRNVGRAMSVPVCDQYQAGIRLKNRAPWTWRLTLSDEIHPNMDGHKRMAEELCRTIAGKIISLDDVRPPSSLMHVRTLLQQQKPIRVLAMPPYDVLIASALKKLNETASVEVTTWSVAGKSIVELEAEAKALVRPLRPDLVVLAVPRDAIAENDEQFVHSYAWIMSWSLSFGQQEWDCVVVHPSVVTPELTGVRDALIRRLVSAQHLELIDRDQNDKADGTAVFLDSWIKRSGK